MDSGLRQRVFKGRSMKRGFILLGLFSIMMFVGAFVRWAPSPPRDDAVIANFNAHRDGFEMLRAELCARTDALEVVDGKRPRSNPALPPEELARYLEAVRAIGVKGFDVIPDGYEARHDISIVSAVPKAENHCSLSFYVFSRRKDDYNTLGFDWSGMVRTIEYGSMPNNSYVKLLPSLDVIDYGSEQQGIYGRPINDQWWMRLSYFSGNWVTGGPVVFLWR